MRHHSPTEQEGEYNTVRVVSSIIVVVLALTFIVGFIGYTNPYVPAGHVGYVYSTPILIGQGGYSGLKQGPGRYGLGWRNSVELVDIRPEAYHESFKIRMKDNLNLTVELYVKAAPQIDKVKELIEDLGPEWYINYLRPELRAMTRKVIARYKSEELPQLRGIVAKEIKYGFKEGEEIIAGIDTSAITDYIRIYSIMVSNIDFPDIVDQEITRKLAARQELEKMQTTLEIEIRKAEIRVAEAEGIAKAQGIINKTLTLSYLQHEAIVTMKELVGSPNTTFYFVPTSTQGAGLPLVLGLDKE